MIGISEELTVIRPGGALSPRCAGVLEAALAGRQAEVLSPWLLKSHGDSTTKINFTH